MAEGLEFDIKANLGNTISNLERVEKELNDTGKAAQQAARSMPKLTDATRGATTVFSNFGRIAQDAPFGLIGIANNIDPLIGSLQSFSAQAKQSGGALAALTGSLLGGGGLILATSLLTGGLAAYALQAQKSKGETQKLTNEIRSYAQITDDANSSTDGAVSRVRALAGVLTDTNQSYNVRKRALQELQEINKSYFGDLSIEKSSYQQITAAVNEYANAIFRAAQVKGLEQEIADASKAQRAFAREQKEALTNYLNAQDQFRKANAAIAGEAPKGLAAVNTQVVLLGTEYDKARQRLVEANNALEQNTGVLNTLEKELQRATLAELQFKNLTSETTKELKKKKDELYEIERVTNTTRRSQFNPANVGLDTSRQAPAGGGIQQTQTQALDAARKLDFLIKSINFDKQIAQAAELQSIIDNGINAGIDQFFNALANNQNPFEAMIQGVKRLIVELVSAVAKALILQAISSSVGGGGSDLSAIAKRAGGASFLGGGVRGFATGGFVSQPTMATIAENGPEFVLRPDQLGAIMNMGGGNDWIPEMRLRGEDLFVMFKKVQARYGRNY